MHVLFVNDQAGFGGVPRMIQSLCYALDKVGIQTSVLTYYSSKELVLAFPKKTKVYSLNAKSRFDVVSFFRLKRLLKKIRPDIIHDHFGGFWSFFLTSGKKAPVILHYHNEFKAIEDSPDIDRSLRDRIFLNYLLPRYDSVISVSKHNHSQFQSLNLPEHMCKVIYNFTPTTDKTKPKTSPSKTIGFLGRVVYEKGTDTFVEVFKKLPKESGIGGLIVGSGDDRFMTQLESEVSQLHLPIEFIGYVQDVHAQLDKMDLVVFVSRQEPFGLVLLEAINYGVPIIGVYPENGGGPWEILPNENLGLIRERDIEKLSKMVLELIHSDVKKETLLLRQKEAISTFSEEAAVKQWKILYESLVSKK